MDLGGLARDREGPAAVLAEGLAGCGRADRVEAARQRCAARDVAGAAPAPSPKPPSGTLSGERVGPDTRRVGQDHAMGAASRRAAAGRAEGEARAQPVERRVTRRVAAGWRYPLRCTTILSRQTFAVGAAAARRGYEATRVPVRVACDARGADRRRGTEATRGATHRLSPKWRVSLDVLRNPAPRPSRSRVRGGTEPRHRASRW